MFITYKDKEFFSKELLDKLEIPESDEPGFWYFHGESPKTHDKFLAAIKRAQEMQKDGSYKDFDPYNPDNDEIDAKAYYMFFTNNEPINLSWDEENEKFEIVNGRHRLKMMQLNGIEMTLDVLYGFDFYLMKENEKITENIPEKIEVEKDAFWNIFKNIRNIFKSNNVENTIKKPEFKTIAIAINVDDLSDDILNTLNLNREDLFVSRWTSDDKSYNIFDDRNYDLDNIIKTFKNNDIEIYEAKKEISEEITL